MKNTSGHTHSLWMTTADTPSYPSLLQHTQTEVCIIGAGISGIACAYSLAREGKAVVLIDDGLIGGGETSRTSAHLTYVMDTRFSDLEKIHGRENLTLALQAHAGAINHIEAVVKKENIECGFERVPGYLFLGAHQQGDILKNELELCKQLGLREVNFVPKAPFPSFDTGPALCFQHQAQFHITRFLAGMLAALERLGVRIYSHTHATHIKNGLKTQVHTDQGAVITANATIVATHTPFHNRVFLHTKQSAYRSYIIGALVPRGTLEKALYWDTEDPYHYVRVVDGSVVEGKGVSSDVVIVGGEDHRTGQADDAVKRYQRLEAWLRERISSAQEIVYRWSGQVMESMDGLAFIGRNPIHGENIYVTTGYAGMGLTQGVLSSLILPDLIAKRANPWEKVFDPSRKSFKAAPDFLRENANTIKQYGDWFKGAPVHSVEAIPHESGAIVQRGIKKIAVYRDAEGVCHSFSAICPHLGGPLHWNGSEKSWDCPCHGSRFDRFGKVLHGPADQALPPAYSLQHTRRTK